MRERATNRRVGVIFPSANECNAGGVCVRCTEETHEGHGHARGGKKSWAGLTDREQL